MFLILADILHLENGPDGNPREGIMDESNQKAQVSASNADVAHAVRANTEYYNAWLKTWSAQDDVTEPPGLDAQSQKPIDSSDTLNT